jgi:DNA-binding protein YbaB
MFDKFQQLGQLNKMRQEAKVMQDELSKIKESLEKKGFKVVVTGDQKVEYIEINGEPQPDLVSVINDAMKSVQKKSAKKMLEMGGGLSGLLSGFGK